MYVCHVCMYEPVQYSTSTVVQVCVFRMRAQPNTVRPRNLWHEPMHLGRSRSPGPIPIGGHHLHQRGAQRLWTPALPYLPTQPITICFHEH